MNKIMVSMLILGIFSFSKAEYIIKLPLEQSHGGSLPNGSISLQNVSSQPHENWQPATPQYSEWINQGNLYECSVWVPEAVTQKEGVMFEQTAICMQDQVRTKQEREIDSVSLTFRNNGDPSTETQSNAVYSARQETGTKAPVWECPPFVRSYSNWMEANGGLGMNVYMIWGGNYGTTPYSIVDAKSPYKDIPSGYIYRRGSPMIYETGAIHYSICRTPI